MSTLRESRPALVRRRRQLRARLLATLLVVAAALVSVVLLAPSAIGWLAPVMPTEGVRPGGGGDAGGFSGDEPSTGFFTPTDEHGYIAEGDTISLDDDTRPAIARLDPALLAAARAAAAASMAEQGLELRVTSGWRSPAYQQQLLDDAIREYGPVDARRWVSEPDVSKHVTGDAIDIGPYDATLWMQSNGPRFGLCQIYANEMWHYELATEPDGECPALKDDAAG